MKFRRLAGMLLAFCFLFSLTACGGEPAPDPEPDPDEVEWLESEMLEIYNDSISTLETVQLYSQNTFSLLSDNLLPYPLEPGESCIVELRIPDLSLGEPWVCQWSFIADEGEIPVGFTDQLDTFLDYEPQGISFRGQWDSSDIYLTGLPERFNQTVAGSWSLQSGEEGLLTLNLDGTGVYSADGIESPLRFSYYDDSLYLMFADGSCQTGWLGLDQELNFEETVFTRESSPALENSESMTLDMEVHNSTPLPLTSLVIHSMLDEESANRELLDMPLEPGGTITVTLTFPDVVYNASDWVCEFYLDDDGFPMPYSDRLNDLCLQDPDSLVVCGRRDEFDFPSIALLNPLDDNGEVLVGRWENSFEPSDKLNLDEDGTFKAKGENLPGTSGEYQLLGDRVLLIFDNGEFVSGFYDLPSHTLSLADGSYSLA